MVAVAGLISRRRDDGRTGIDADVVQIEAQGGFSHMASLVGAQAQADHQGHGKLPGQMKEVGDPHHDIVLLVGVCSFPDQVKLPEVLLGRLQPHHGNGGLRSGSCKVLVLSSGGHRGQVGAMAGSISSREYWVP